MRQCAIQELADEDLQAQKQTLRTKEALMRFLSDTYQQPVDEQTLVTIVQYRNQPLVPEDMEVQDDPHM
jgi:hypothetical protein